MLSTELMIVSYYFVYVCQPRVTEAGEESANLSGVV